MATSPSWGSGINQRSGLPNHARRCGHCYEYRAAAQVTIGLICWTDMHGCHHLSIPTSRQLRGASTGSATRDPVPLYTVVKRLPRYAGPMPAGLVSVSCHTSTIWIVSRALSIISTGPIGLSRADVCAEIIFNRIRDRCLEARLAVSSHHCNIVPCPPLLGDGLLA
jgi:hypothetical protein